MCERIDEVSTVWLTICITRDFAESSGKDPVQYYFGLVKIKWTWAVEWMECLPASLPCGKW